MGVSNLCAFRGNLMDFCIQSPIWRLLYSFQTVMLRRLFRVPWTARRPNQSILKEINPEYSLARLMPKLKLQYFGHPMQRANSLEKILTLGKIEGRRRRGGQRMRCWWHHWLNGHEFEQTVEVVNDREGEGQGNLTCCSPWDRRVRHDWANEQLFQ